MSRHNNYNYDSTLTGIVSNKYFNGYLSCHVLGKTYYMHNYFVCQIQQNYCGHSLLNDFILKDFTAT